MHLAHLNIARAKYSLDAPQMKEFVEDLATLNVIAQTSEGFIWRLAGAANNIIEFQLPSDDNVIINFSLWSSLDSLKNFISNTQYGEFMRRKSEWCESMPEENHVLWWQEEGVIPTVDGAMVRLEHLRSYGDSPYAFSFKVPFTFDKA